MKNKITKQTRKDIKSFYRKLKKSGIFLLLIKLPFIIRLLFSIILFIYGVLAWVIPIFPFATASLVIAGLLLYPDTKFFQSQTLYYLNKSRVNKKIIEWYIMYKMLGKKTNKK